MKWQGWKWFCSISVEDEPLQTWTWNDICRPWRTQPSNFWVEVVWLMRNSCLIVQKRTILEFGEHLLGEKGMKTWNHKPSQSREIETEWRFNVWAGVRKNVLRLGYWITERKKFKRFISPWFISYEIFSPECCVKWLWNMSCIYIEVSEAAATKPKYCQWFGVSGEILL